VIIAQQQAAPCPLWSALLLHAFRGMLLRLSRSLVGVDDADDADARVATGLLHALRRVRPERDPERIGMYVRQETRRAVFLALRRDSRARPYWPEEEEDEPPPRSKATPGEDPADDVEEDARPPGGGSRTDDDASSDEPARDPIAVARVSRCLDPDALADAESRLPLEDRMVFYRPTASGVPDEHLLRAHAVRGGLRRLTDHLFSQASAREREAVYRQLRRRTRKLLADAK
jgi:hypothetical protein